jgi:cytochrome c oxidase cbb3-type subunit 3
MRLVLAAAAALAMAIGQQQPGTFPAMQRPPAPPDVIARGKAVYGANCVPCHGDDARGGQLNGPNLLRSQLVLADKNGELITPVVQNGRAERGMPAFPLSNDDLTAVVEFVHSLTAASPGQGAPPRVEAPPPDIVVGDAEAGRAYFAATCSRCHSVEGDLRGIASRAGDAKALQNLWVSGGATAFGRGRGGDASRSSATATITPRGGQAVRGRVIFVDDFEIKIVQEDGTLRTFARDGDVPRVEISDPLQAHKELLSALTDKDMRDVTAYLVTLK